MEKMKEMNQKTGREKRARSKQRIENIERKIKRLEARRGTGTIRAKLCRKVEINERFQPDEP